ncbi:MAG: PP2C family protein-serine/threonine phosphatase [Flavobacteriales bacterium]
MARLERIIERLELKEFQLKALLDVTKAIANNVPRVDLLTLYERIMHDDLGITRLMLFEHKGSEWQRIVAYGTNTNGGEIDIARAVERYTDIQVIDSAGAAELGAFDVAVPVQHRERMLAFLLIGDIDEDEQRMSPAVKHLNYIQTLTNLIAVALENQRLAQEALLRVRADRELELAREMQRMLVPADLPNNKVIHAAAWYQPHDRVGGDHYDLITLEDGSYMACVADVSGKGIAAALLMSNFQANLHASVRHNTDLATLVHELNVRVQDNARGERFITLFIAHYQPSTRTLRYANCGHNPPLLHSPGQLRTLQEGSIALGMMPGLPFLQIGEVTVAPDSTLLCYTDGLVEQENEAGEAFGTKPLEELLRDGPQAGPASLNEGVVKAYERHKGNEPIMDDIALLTCRFH